MDKQNLQNLPKQLFALLAFLLPISIFAQSAPDAIYLANGDSLRGTIIERGNKVEGARISFRPADQKTAAKTYMPSEIAGYRVGQRRYESHRVKYYIARNLEDLERGMRPPQREIQAFLEVLFDGEHDLYMFTDSAAWLHYYVRSGDRSPVELPMFEYYAYRETVRGREKIIERDAVYQVMLEELFRDCPEVARAGYEVLFEGKAMTQVFIDYHHCKHPGMAFYVQARRKLKVLPGIVIGQFTNFFSARNPFHQFRSRSPVGPAYGILFGADVEFALPRAKGLWRLNTGLHFAKLVTSDSTRIEYGGGDFDDNSMMTDGFMIRLDLGARRDFSSSSIHPFFGFGVVMMIASEPPTRIERRHVGMSTSTRITELSMGTFQLPLYVSLGLRIRNFMLEARFESNYFPGQLVGDIDLSHRLHINLAYHFGNVD
ncbi:MAG: hypothetical protein AAF570_17555 [Bacteroidota bacterium]